MEWLPPWTGHGTDLSRVLALSDGVFAFAMTLLVLGLALPSGFRPREVGSVLQNLQAAFLAYLLSFVVIFFYWIAHQQIFTYITSYDRRLLNLNVAFLLFIALMPFLTDLISAAPGVTLSVTIYAAVQVAAGLSLMALWTYASRSRRHVSSSLPDEWIRYIRLRTFIAPAVFAASIPIAYWNASIAEYSWLLVFVLQVVIRHRSSGRPGTEGEGARSVVPRGGSEPTSTAGPTKGST